MLIGLILEDKILDFVESKSKIVDGPAEPAAAEASSEEGAAKGRQAKKKKSET